MDFMQEYEKWFHSPALSPEEHAELESIKDDPKEIESRFFGPLEFGTAGLRGTMYTGNLLLLYFYLWRSMTAATIKFFIFILY